MMKIFGSRARKADFYERENARLKKTIKAQEAQINQLMRFLEDRSSIVKEVVALTETKNAEVRRLKNRERDLLEVIRQSQVAEMMSWENSDEAVD